jgi:hypothetical protein
LTQITMMDSKESNHDTENLELLEDVAQEVQSPQKLSTILRFFTLAQVFSITADYYFNNYRLIR